MPLDDIIEIKQLLHFDTDKIPDLKTKKIGDIVNFIIKTKVVGINEKEGGNITYRLEILENDIKPKITSEEFFSLSEENQAQEMEKSVELT